MEPTAGRAGREAPKPPAMTPVVGARFTRVVHTQWGRSTVRPLASALLRFVLFFCLFSLVFQFVHSIRFVRHSFFGSRKEPRIHVTILQKGYILEAQRDQKKVHFAALMDISHLKKCELDPKFQKYRGRVVLRGDTVNDDTGPHAVLTGQGYICVSNDSSKK